MVLVDLLIKELPALQFFYFSFCPSHNLNLHLLAPLSPPPPLQVHASPLSSPPPPLLSSPICCRTLCPPGSAQSPGSRPPLLQGQDTFSLSQFGGRRGRRGEEEGEEGGLVLAKPMSQTGRGFSLHSKLKMYKCERNFCCCFNPSEQTNLNTRS